MRQPAPTRNPALTHWVSEMATLTQPDRVVWCDGSEAERLRFTEEAVRVGSLIPLNPALRPNSYLHRSNPNDVARVEKLTAVRHTDCAPATISMISRVIPACRTLFMLRVSRSTISRAFLVALSIAVIRAACSAADDSSTARATASASARSCTSTSRRRSRRCASPRPRASA